MLGSVPVEVRQDIIDPLQDLPNILEVCCFANGNGAHMVLFVMANTSSKTGQPDWQGWH